MHRAQQHQSIRSSRSETTDFTFDDEQQPEQRSVLIRRDVTFSEWCGTIKNDTSTRTEREHSHLACVDMKTRNQNHINICISFADKSAWNSKNENFFSRYLWANQYDHFLLHLFIACAIIFLFDAKRYFSLLFDVNYDYICDCRNKKKIIDLDRYICWLIFPIHHWQFVIYREYAIAKGTDGKLGDAWCMKHNK